MHDLCKETVLNWICVLPEGLVWLPVVFPACISSGGVGAVN